jgi:hypothetical protein
MVYDPSTIDDQFSVLVWPAWWFNFYQSVEQADQRKRASEATRVKTYHALTACSPTIVAI